MLSKMKEAEVVSSVMEKTVETISEDQLNDIYVPRSQRRGLFANVVLVKERVDPRSYPDKIKYFIVFTISISAIIAPMGTNLFLPAINNVATDLNSTTDVINISYGMYVLALGIFPVWWSSFSEFSGRRTVYIISFFIFICFTIGCALCKNIGSLIAFRILSGGAAASVQAVGAGTIGDIYVSTQRGRAMGYYYFGPLCGPLLAPIFGGLIVTKWNWRATQWFLVIVGCVVYLLLLFGLPETLNKTSGNVALANNSEQQQPSATSDPPLKQSSISQSGQSAQSAQQPLNKAMSYWKVVLKIFLDPFHTIQLFRYPPVALAITYATFTFFTLYLLNLTVQSLFTHAPYNFSAMDVGFSYIPSSIGYFLASVLNGYWSDHILKRSIRKKGIEIPESRIAENIYVAAAVFPVSLLMLGWTANYKVFWIIPMIAMFLFGISSMIIFGTVNTYLVDALPGKASAGIALNNLVRMTMAAIGAFIALPLENAMGFGWLYTMLAILAALASFSAFAIKIWGAKWRASFDIDKFS